MGVRYLLLLFSMLFATAVQPADCENPVGIYNIVYMERVTGKKGWVEKTIKIEVKPTQSGGTYTSARGFDRKQFKTIKIK